MLNMIPKNIDFMGILRTISNSPNPGVLFQQALKQYPQLQTLIQTWQNSQDPQALLKQFFGNTPQYQQIMQKRNLSICLLRFQIFHQENVLLGLMKTIMLRSDVLELQEFLILNLMNIMNLEQIWE